MATLSLPPVAWRVEAGYIAAEAIGGPASQHAERPSSAIERQYDAVVRYIHFIHVRSPHANAMPLTAVPFCARIKIVVPRIRAETPIPPSPLE
jgi:hypothetical protein